MVDSRESRSIRKHKKSPSDSQEPTLKKKPLDFTAADLADRYGVEVSYIHRCKKLRAIAVKRGKYLFYPYDKVLAWEEYRRKLNRGYFIDDFIRLRVEKGKLPTSLSPLKFDIAD